VVITDVQAPGGSINVGTLEVQAEFTTQYDILITAATPTRNTATASGNGPNGPLPEPSDPAVINTDPQPNPALEIVKTVLPGPNATCPAFDGGTPGDGLPLELLYDDVATYCISVRNSGPRAATGVVVTDAQAPGQFDIGTLDIDEEQTVSYDLTITADTPIRNTAIADGNGPNGPLPSVSDTVVKTVLPGPEATCPAFDGGTPGDGLPLEFLYDDVATFCISIRNSGPRVATDVAIADDQATPQPPPATAPTVRFRSRATPR